MQKTKTCRPHHTATIRNHNGRQPKKLPKNQSMANRNQLLRPPTIQKQPHHVPCRNDCLSIRWWWCWCPWWWWWWPVTMTVVEICMPFALHNYRIRIWNAYLLPNLPFHVSINQTSYQLLFVVFRVPSSFVNASSLFPKIYMYITTICIYPNPCPTPVSRLVCPLCPAPPGHQPKCQLVFSPSDILIAPNSTRTILSVNSNYFQIIIIVIDNQFNRLNGRPTPREQEYNRIKSRAWNSYF